MIIDKDNNKHIIAEEGMVLSRTVGSPFIAKQVFLRKVKINGELVDDVVENYKEIPESEVKPKGQNGPEEMFNEMVTEA